MGKKHIITDRRVVLRGSAIYVGETEMQVQDRLRTEAIRHLGHITMVSPESTSEIVCEYCGYPWDPKQKNYNGCCEKDEEMARGTEEWKAVNPDTRSPTDG